MNSTKSWKKIDRDNKFVYDRKDRKYQTALAHERDLDHALGPGLHLLPGVRDVDTVPEAELPRDPVIDEPGRDRDLDRVLRDTHHAVQAAVAVHEARDDAPSESLSNLSLSLSLCQTERGLRERERKKERETLRERERERERKRERERER